MKFFEQLKKAILSENLYQTEEILKQIREEDNSIKYVGNILELMEENPDLDYGSPGPLVHYMEEFYGNGYEKLLCESVARKPIAHTLWMIHRIINDVDGEEQEYYYDLIEKTANNPDIPDDIREEAKSYLD